VPIVVPSQVCDFIDREFARIPRDNARSQVVALGSHACGSLRALVSLLEAIPSALLPADPNDFGALVSSIETIKFQVSRAEREGFPRDTFAPGGDRNISGNILLTPTPTSGNWNPVMVIRQALERCSDDVAHAASKEFPFVKDPDVRQELLADLESARSALRNAEWKPATVIAGALAEALLLWAIDQYSEPEVRSAIDGALKNRELTKRPASDPDGWVLHEYIAVAHLLNFLQDDCWKQLDRLHEFRNLIHPGRTRRVRKRCDRGTALAANAGVELLARDLEAKFP